MFLALAHAVTVDGKPLAHDPLLNNQNYTFQGTPNIVLKWSLSSANQLPAVTITTGAHLLISNWMPQDGSPLP